MNTTRHFLLKPVFTAIVLLLFFFSGIVFAQPAQYKGIDNHMLRTIEKYRTPKENSFFKTLSKLNNPVCLSGPVSLLGIGIIQPDKILRKKSLFGVESIAAGQLFTFSLKYLIKRPRPHLRDTSFTSVVNAHNASFPSGHTAEAFAMATAMSIAVHKWYVMVPVYAWASLMAYARMYLGVHYPSDVLGGAVVGAGSAYLMYELNKWIQKDDKGKHPANEITGVFVGLGTSYILYHLNNWIHKGKRRATTGTPSF